MLIMAEPARKVDTGLKRGQAAKISRIHRLSITAVLKAAKTGKGRPGLLKTIQEYRDRNAAEAEGADAQSVSAALPKAG